MKTPRELILERHQPTEASLKTIRAEDLAACAREASAQPRRQPRSPVHLASAASQIWQEVIGPWRRIWLGLAAGWLVIVGVNLATGDIPKVAHRKAPLPDAEQLAVLREQKQLLAHLLESAPLPPAAPPKARGPRSERLQTNPSV